MAKKNIANKSEDFSAWYHDVVVKAELADYAPVKGCMVIRPYGYAIWEAIQRYLDAKIKEKGIANAYFPIFIPESFLKREKDHVEGFSPLVAVVTYAGGEELKEKLAVRPTSETIMYEMYKRWTQSYRDLPILINQWNNVVRWEKRTYLFLRTSEFLWQEGHCAHATHEESLEMVLWSLRQYVQTYQNLLGLYGVAGAKSAAEKFAGADKTYTYEMLMPDGKALQGCTSHDLGQNFAKAFDWTVLDKDGGRLYPWQNSWGLSTRSIGGLVMAHGDDDGLILPPAVAPIQVVIVPIPGSDRAAKQAAKLKEKLSKFRCLVDTREGQTAGFKFNKWEFKGVPLRIEVGDYEASSGVVTLARRNTGERVSVAKDKLANEIGEELDRIQDELARRHEKFTKANSRSVESYNEFKKIMAQSRGFISAFWCEDPRCEEAIKNETKATTRCLPVDLETGQAKEEKGECLYCQKKATHRWLFAQAY